MSLAANTVGHIANIVKGYAIAIGVAYAIGYFWKLRRQTIAWRETDTRAKAQNLWSDFLKRKLAFVGQAKHPTGPEQTKSDLSFMAYLLSVAEEILILDPSDNWRATLKEELATHKSLLGSDKINRTLMQRHSDELRALLDDALKNP